SDRPARPLRGCVMQGVSRRALPGFGLGLGYTIFYLSVLVLLPLAACAWKAASLGPREFLAAVWSERAQAAYLLTFSVAAMAAVANVFLGLIVAWSLVRYSFPGKRLVDATLYMNNGWLGQFLVPIGIEAAYTKLGIVLVLIFTGFPFVVRTVQPVLADLD